MDFVSFIKQRHKFYAIRYWGCELLCLINIILQMWLMDRFFDGEFLSYGWRVMNLSDTPQEQRYDPMVSDESNQHVWWNKRIEDVAKSESQNNHFFHFISTGIRLSSCYKVHLPQIWCFWIDTKTRFSLHSTPEYC